MPACQGRPCTSDRQICHCTGWPSQWHSDGLWDRRPGCRGAGILLALFRLYYYYAFMYHRPLIFDPRGEGSDISPPCMCSQTFERSPKAFVLWCWGTEGAQTSLFWCPLNVKMSKVMGDEKKRQTSLATDYRKTFPTDQIKKPCLRPVQKRWRCLSYEINMKFMSSREKQEWHTVDRSFLNAEKMFFFLG